MVAVDSQKKRSKQGALYSSYGLKFGKISREHLLCYVKYGYQKFDYRSTLLELIYPLQILTKSIMVNTRCY